jgi:ATP-dependent RNA helicase DDX18/HAS1
MLFSATLNPKISSLAKLSLRPNPIYINANPSTSTDPSDQEATNSQLQQGYVICESDMRFKLLFTFLRKVIKGKKKAIVFFSSCNEVKYFSELLNYVDVKVTELHVGLSTSHPTGLKLILSF